MDTEKKRIRALETKATIIDAQRGIVDYVASDESLDSYREIILAKGWKFSMFEKNAPFVNSHDYSDIRNLVGKVTDFKVKGKALIERVQWAIDAPDNELAKLGWQMTTGGYLKAVSVGFRPVKMSWPGRDDWADAVKEAGLTAEQCADCYAIYMEQEQLELSTCIIGANPNALAKAHDDGAVKDAQLAACGFDDDDMHFLHLAAKAGEQTELDALTRAMMARQFENILRKGRGQAATTPSQRAGGEEAERRDASRTDFLKRLNEIANRN